MNQYSLKFLIFNVISFYIYWWLCLIGSSRGDFFYGPLAALVYFIIHFFIIDNKYKEFKYIIICMILGILIETLMLQLNFIEYRGYLSSNYNIAPLWVIVLWMGFGTTVFHSFKWVLGKYKLSFLLGAIFTPVIYFSAYKIGSIAFNYNVLTSYLILSLIWGFTLLLLIYIADKIT